MLKLIASDIDGTLLRGGTRELPEEIFEIIKKLREKGILFAAASGRPFSSLQKLFYPVKDEILYIAENGTLFSCGGALECTAKIERADGIEILEFVRNDENCEILLASPGMSYTQSDNAKYLNFVKNDIKYELTEVEDITKVADTFIKIAVCDLRGIEYSFEKYKEKFSDKFTVVTSGSIWLDIIPKTANKGAALKMMLSRLKINAEDCIAFGDEFNDIEMLKLAGVGYAVSSGQEKVKQCADKICDDPVNVMKKILMEK